MSTRCPLNVLFTIDTEVWPRRPDWRARGLADDLERDVYGATPQGRFGATFQSELLRSHGLRAVFFVEALFACEVGLAPLRELIAPLQRDGHEVQLHLHSEWLRWLTISPLPGRVAQNVADLDLDAQVTLIRHGLQNLRAAGATDVCAFRAGNYGANFDTLRALARLGVRYDTSYDYPSLPGDCALHLPEMLVQPAKLEGVEELPIGCFRDYPGHYRHAQLSACSTGELTRALEEAWRRGWDTFVLVSHSFELLRNCKVPNGTVRPDTVVLRRFERLCAYLEQNRDRFETVGFRQLRERPATAPPYQPPLQPRLPTTLVHTARRYAEQAVRRAATR